MPYRPLPACTWPVLLLGYLLAFAPAPAYAQVAVGLTAGGATYLGDLAPTSPLDHVAHAGSSYGAFARVPLWGPFRARAFAQRSHVSGDDADRPRTRTRNLSFATAITEVGLVVEAGVTWAGLRAYGFGGGSVYRFNPLTEYRGRVVALQPLGTEGQGTPGYGQRYGLTRLAVPIGAGLELAVTPRWTIGVELSGRATFFDYLDDVSAAYAPPEAFVGPDAGLRRALADRRGEGTDGSRPAAGGPGRGDPGDNDWFNVGLLTVAYQLPQLRGDGARGKRARRGGPSPWGARDDRRAAAPPCYDF